MRTKEKGTTPMDTNDKYPFALPAGTVLSGQYVIERVLGQGGFGITYQATDHHSGERVAIKEYFPDSLAGRTDKVRVTAFSDERGDSFNYGKDCFLQEAETLAEFIGNENIVRVYTYFEENGTAYFVMDFVEGMSLDRYMRNHGGRISYAEAEQILLPIMDALAAVNSKGIVHRDVTPDNIYLTVDGNVKLLDFGAARYSLGDRSKSLDVVLKHGFAPKEQYTRRGRQGAFTDVYSLGATFYYAVTGRRPPDSIDRIDEDIMVPPSYLGVNIPPQKEYAIMVAMSVNAQDRYQSMPEFKQALLATGGQVPKRETQPKTVHSSASDNELVLEERKMMLFLESREWWKARRCSDKILAKNPENAMAYLAKLMIDNKYTVPEQLKRHKTSLENEKYFKIALRYADDELRSELESYNDAVKLRRYEDRIKNKYKNAESLMKKGGKKNFIEARDLLISLGNYREAFQLIDECEERIITITETDYSTAINLYYSGRLDNYVRAKRIFAELGSYRESARYLEECEQMIDELGPPAKARSVSKTIRTVIIMLTYLPASFILLVSILFSINPIVKSSDWRAFIVIAVMLVTSVGKIIYSLITHLSVWNKLEDRLPLIGSDKVKRNWFLQTLLRLLVQVMITSSVIVAVVIFLNLYHP
ncbi:MAG: serine/threonine protein kinase [Lachnospiraceae bacterium]|nr:serine/threonine protein kinase [Lachnospiraceae bacterium]